MPYQPRAERERASWFIWRQTVDYIASADRCSNADADGQLRKAIEDGAFPPYSLKWVDAPPERGGVGPVTGGAWRGWPALSSWCEVEFGGDGRVVNVPESVLSRPGPLWFGPFLILRERVVTIWPMQRSQPATAPVQREVGDWLRSEISKDAAGLKAKADFRTEAQGRWSGQIGRMFDRAWSEVAEEFPDRGRPGRKPRRSNRPA
jgi:hypothetical protein